MRTGTFTRTDTVELVDKPVPDIGPTEVLLEVAGVGLCHSDMAIIGQPDSPLIGSTLGHEVAGTVAEVGTGGSWTGRPTTPPSSLWSCPAGAAAHVWPDATTGAGRWRRAPPQPPCSLGSAAPAA